MANDNIKNNLPDREYPASASEPSKRPVPPREINPDPSIFNAVYAGPVNPIPMPMQTVYAGPDYFNNRPGPIAMMVYAGPEQMNPPFGPIGMTLSDATKLNPIPQPDGPLITCPCCGYQIQHAGKFCPECGTSLPRTEKC